jgi:hypothetical protein
MNKKEFVKVTRCPRCGSFEIYNLDHDQMCLKCDWDNFKYLVDMGQLDNLSRAERAQFMGVKKKGASKKVPKLKTNSEAIITNKTAEIMEVSNEREAI